MKTGWTYACNLNDFYSVDELKDVCKEAERWAIYRVVASVAHSASFDPTAHRS